MSGAYIGRVGLCGAFGLYSKDSRRAGEGRHRHARSPGRADVKSYDEAGCTSLLGTNLETAKTPRRLAMLHWRSEADTLRDSLRPPPIEALPCLLPKNLFRG